MARQPMYKITSASFEGDLYYEDKSGGIATSLAVLYTRES